MVFLIFCQIVWLIKGIKLFVKNIAGCQVICYLTKIGYFENIWNPTNFLPPFFLKIAQNFTKGQLISKCLFGIFNSPKKWMKKFYGTSSRIVFIHFLGELKTPKRHFKSNWPLKLSKIFIKSFTTELMKFSTWPVRI